VPEQRLDRLALVAVGGRGRQEDVVPEVLGGRVDTSSTHPARRPASTNTSTSPRARWTGTSSPAPSGTLEFDGIATVCVFAWEERAVESSTFMLARVSKELAGRPR